MPKFTFIASGPAVFAAEVEAATEAEAVEKAKDPQHWQLRDSWREETEEQFWHDRDIYELDEEGRARLVAEGAAE